VIARYDCIYIEGYLLVNEPLVRTVMERAKRTGLTIALDLSNFNIVNAYKDLLDDLISAYVDILFANESEAQAFTGQTPAEAIGKIADKVDIAVVMLGKEGAMIARKGETVHVAAEEQQPVDTTGAGDHFAAGFLYGLSAGATLEQAGRIGALLAGNAVRVVGPQIPPDRWKQIRSQVNR